MATKRKFREFTPEELKVIKSNSGKVTLVKLAEIMGINYTNLSTALNQHRVPFTPFKTPKVMPKKESSALVKIKNERGELLLTDDIIQSWYAQ